MMISENATQAKENAPSALDGVAAATSFIAKIVMDISEYVISGNSSNEVSTIVPTLFAEHGSSIGQIRASLIRDQRLNRQVVLRYFEHCVKRTIGRREVEATLKNLEASGVLADIALGAITSANAKAAALLINQSVRHHRSSTSQRRAETRDRPSAWDQAS